MSSPGPIPQPPPFDTVIGAFLITSWARSALTMAEYQQAFKYFNGTARGDGIVLKTAMALVVLLNTANSCVMLNVIFTTILTMFETGKPPIGIFPSPFALSTTTSLNSLIQVIVQAYLTRRLFILTRSWIFLGLISFICSCGVIGTFVTIGLLNSDHASLAGTVMFGVGLCFGAAGDLMITAVLVMKLRSMDSVCSGFKETDSLIRRLIITSIQTGSTSSVIAITIAAVFIVGDRSAIGSAISLLLGPSFSLSMLINLNLRGELRESHSAILPSSQHSGHRENQTQQPHQQSYHPAGISVQHVQKAPTFVNISTRTSSLPLKDLDMV